MVATVDDASLASTSTPTQVIKQIYDYVVLSTKNLPDLHPPAAIVSPVITAGYTTIVLIQNGLDVELPLIAAFPTNTVISSVAMIGSAIVDPNRAVQVGPDTSKIGAHFHDGLAMEVQERNARAWVEMYAAGGCTKCEYVPDMPAARWDKLLWNVTYNSLCALLRVNLGEMQSSGARETLILPMMAEIQAIAASCGVTITEETIQFMVERGPLDSPYRPSMLLDLENGRPMEVEVIVGNPLRRAEGNGVEAPVLRTVYRMLKVAVWKMESDGAAATL